MKYVFEYIKNIDELFKLLNTKVKEEGFIIMTKGVMDSKLKSHSSNVHYAYNDELIPLGEERQLKDGDKIGMHFFAETDNPQAGYLDGAITSKYFYSMKIIRDLAKKYGFEIFIGEWDSYLQNRDNIPVGLKDFSQGVIILEK